MRARPGLVCLVGDWVDGSAVVTSDPVAVVTGDAAFDALDRVPELVAGAQEHGIGGGWFGVLGYDGRHHMAFHDWVLRLVDGAWWFESLYSSERADELALARARAVAALAQPPARDEPGDAVVGEVSGPAREVHLAAVEYAIGHIRAGDVYQVNVCTRLAADFRGSALDLFAHTVHSLEPAYGAFADTGVKQLVSLSPELFLLRRGREVVTAPIKGTRPRSGVAAGPDDPGAADLRRSVKDAAENVMIVDLMRNDLGRVCVTGSVAVDRLLDIEPHPGVWHLVSRVRGRLRADVGDAALLRATFAPGSVTGAPKVRAVEVIAEVENRSRGSYTGAIGFVSPCWGAQFSVAIRTFEVSARAIELGVGGGITADSIPALEWQECLQKAAPLLVAAGARPTPDLALPEAAPTRTQRDSGVLETVLVLDGVPLRLADHLARLDRSCRELYGEGLLPGVEDEARSCAAAAGPGRFVLRLVVAPGRSDVTCAPAADPPGVSAVRTVARAGGCWRHKWADRAELGAAEAARPGVAPLFVAADGTVLETSRGNVFLLLADGALVTPPLREDLLPGVTRRALLDLALDEGRRVELRPFRVDDAHGGVLFWTSSLSLAVPIAEVDGVATPRDDAAVASFAAALSGGVPTVR